jgi:hypothetical protein
MPISLPKAVEHWKASALTERTVVTCPNEWLPDEGPLSKEN